MKNILLLFLLLFNTETFAVTGNDLYKWMQSNDSVSKAYSESYILGVTDSLALVFGLSDEAKRPYPCLPKNGAYQQIFDVTKKYLADNPQKRHENAYILSFKAIREAFPCEK